jgi:hypothetical protein
VVPISAPLRDLVFQVFVRRLFLFELLPSQDDRVRARSVARASLEVKCIGEGRARRLCKFGGRTN